MRTGAAAIQAAIIDLDGTMLHTVPDFELALNGMRAEYKLAPITQDVIKPMVGKGSEKLIRAVLALDFDVDRIDACFDEAMAAYQRHYLAINGEKSVLFDGANSAVLLREKHSSQEFRVALPQTGQFSDLKPGESVHFAFDPQRAVCFPEGSPA